MQLKLLIHLTVVTTALFLNAKISLAESLKVPYVSISGFQAPLWLGEKAGAFRKNQLEVQLIYMPGGSLIVQTLLSGEVGIASLAPPSAISAWTKGAELVLVAGGIERALNVLMVSPKIKTPDDLKGKRVAISRFGSLSDISLRDALRFYKLRPSQDVAIAQIGGLGERMVALTSGVVDAAILNVDQVYQAEKLGYLVLIDSAEIALELLDSRYSCQQGLSQKPKEHGETLLEGLYRGHQDSQDGQRVLHGNNGKIHQNQ